VNRRTTAAAGLAAADSGLLTDTQRGGLRASDLVWTGGNTPPVRHGPKPPGLRMTHINGE
jgi:hypothetical protein